MVVEGLLLGLTYWRSRGCSSVARASACHAEGRGFESHHPLHRSEADPTVCFAFLFLVLSFLVLPSLSGRLQAGGARYDGPHPARTERGGPEAGGPVLLLPRRPFAHRGTRQTSGTKQKAWRSRIGHRFEREGFTHVLVAASSRPDHPQKDDLLGDRRVVSLAHPPARTRLGMQSLRGTHLAVNPLVRSMAGRTMRRPRERTDCSAARRTVRSSIPAPDRSH